MNSLAIAWKAMFLVGVVAILIGLPLYVRAYLAPDTLDPGGQDYIGRPISDVRQFDPLVAEWMFHENKEALFSLFVIGFAICAIAWKAYSRAEKWSWYALAMLTVGYLASYVAVHAPIGYYSYLPVAVPMLFVSVAALMLPIRHFFLGGIGPERRPG